MSFTKLPSFDFSISSFGGVDLSTIPMAFGFVNSSLYWVLEQYTDPHSVELDFRHTICPECDRVPVPSMQEMFFDSTVIVGKSMKMWFSRCKEKIHTYWKKVKNFWNQWKRS